MFFSYLLLLISSSTISSLTLFRSSLLLLLLLSLSRNYKWRFKLRFLIENLTSFHLLSALNQSIFIVLRGRWVYWITGFATVDFTAVVNIYLQKTTLFLQFKSSVLFSWNISYMIKLDKSDDHSNCLCQRFISHLKCS
jgi:hypothetical protein